MKISQADALLIVDVQNDFCPGGALGVQDGDKIIPFINLIAPKFSYVFASRDWHPVNHSSFKPQGGIWPVHCVRGTKGADFHPVLSLQNLTHIIHKATKSDADAYSAFDGTGLAGLMHALAIQRIFICGLATDYCVSASALDALKARLQVYVITDAIKAVNIKPDDGEKSLQKMFTAGTLFINHTEI